MAEGSRPLIELESLSVEFPNRHRNAGEPHNIVAVDDLSLAIEKGEILGIVGESGSGKTTLGKTMLRLYRPSRGRIRYAGTDITSLDDAALRPHRRDLQMIFQDPLSSFNPRTRIGDAIALPLRIHRLCTAAERVREVDRLLERVGLSRRFKMRFPHEMSGGQLQRVAIARALALRPRVIVADESVSKLDVSVRAQILNLFRDVQRETGVALVFVTHDLRVARYLCQRIAVMFFGRLVELGPTEALFAQPRHPYTAQLLGSRGEAAVTTAAEEPAPPAGAEGCRYRSRCPIAIGLCAERIPPLIAIGNYRQVACHRSQGSSGSQAS
jgi:peptide/nickel transport system ATP-binding protein/oligopeptide transport system ATP-binding protein